MVFGRIESEIYRREKEVSGDKAIKTDKWGTGKLGRTG